MTSTQPVRATFRGSSGDELAARLDLPAGPPRGFALFAHCFTCSKDVAAAKRIAAGLAKEGLGVLRFDFTGLGSSQGEFANTNFSSNVEDLVLAADFLRAHYEAPVLLVGHSLGGAAVLAAADDIPEAKAVVTIGAPADVAHVLHHFESSLDAIRENGEAPVVLGGREFTIRRSFIENAQAHRLSERIARLGKALLVLHAPLDTVVGIENATRIFTAAKHPKSFVSLDDADHLLTGAASAGYVARVISAWSAKYIPEMPPAASEDTGAVIVSETGQGRFQTAVAAGRHRLIADEPVAVGGLDSGPTPYDYLSAALGGCTAMTLRLYAEHKSLNVGAITVRVSHGKVNAAHCEDCGAAAEGRTGKIDRFERVISVAGGVEPELAEKLAEIAEKCPVHRTIVHGAAVVTRMAETDRPFAPAVQPKASGV